MLSTWGGACLLEFGAGRSGLAGLVLASSAASAEAAGSSAPRSVVVTDGHPRAAADLARQCCLTQLHCGLRCPLTAATLVWTTDPHSSLGRPAAVHFQDKAPASPPPAADAAAAADAPAAVAAAASAGTSRAATASKLTSEALPSRQPVPAPGLLELSPASVDCILAADVAFFERFHEALLETAAYLLKPVRSGAQFPDACSGGEAAGAAGSLSDASLAEAVTAPGSLVVLAPSRGGSLERLELAARAFSVTAGASSDTSTGTGSAIGGTCTVPATGEAEVASAPAFSVRRIEGVGPWLSAAALGGAPIEGQEDAAAGPLQLLILQRLADPSPSG